MFVTMMLPMLLPMSTMPMLSAKDLENSNPPKELKESPPPTLSPEFSETKKCTTSGIFDEENRDKNLEWVFSDS